MTIFSVFEGLAVDRVFFVVILEDRKRFFGALKQYQIFSRFVFENGAVYVPVSYTHLDVYKRQVPTQSAAPLIADGRRMQREFAAVLTVGIPEEELSVAERTAAKIAANINAFVKGEKQ